jgi:hypothetical protein
VLKNTDAFKVYRQISFTPGFTSKFKKLLRILSRAKLTTACVLVSKYALVQFMHAADVWLPRMLAMHRMEAMAHATECTNAPKKR